MVSDVGDGESEDERTRERPENERMREQTPTLTDRGQLEMDGRAWDCVCVSRVEGIAL